MSTKVSVLSRAVVLLIILFIASLPVVAQSKPVISGPIDNGSRLTIAGSKHPLALPQFDAGAVDPGIRLQRMLLVLEPSPEQELELQKLLDAQQDRTSRQYHRWLTPEEFGQKFGPAQQDIQAVTGWLTRQGFTVGQVAASGRWIEFSGSVAQTERTFGTLLRKYQISGAQHIANSTDLSIPTAVAPVVRGVVSLHNFFKKPAFARMLHASINGDGTYTPISPDATLNGSNGPVHALTPGDYANIYQLSPLYAATPTALDGTGVTIAIVARRDASLGDFSEFRQITGLSFRLPVNTVTLPPDPGFDPNDGDSVEVDLDAEWAGGVAPGATINVIASASTATTDGVDLSSAYAVDHNIAPVLSVSFGACEADMGPTENAFFSALWQQAAAQGMSVMVSTGDSGAAGCDLPIQPTPATHGLAINGLASTRFNTAVGGTQFQDTVSPSTFWSTTNSSAGVSVLGYIPEAAWNETCDPTTPGSPCAAVGFRLAGTGGGASTLYDKPAWQIGLAGIPNDLKRDIPDVSLSAASHDGYVICFNGSCLNGQVGIVGGTSASSPSFAGMMAIVNQALGRQGLANYKLYELAQNAGAFCNSAARTSPAVPAGSCPFNDVISGTNNVPGLNGFSAGTSYDLATGLGSVNAANLVNAWKGISLIGTSVALSSTAGTSITTAHGQPVPITITVTGSATSPAPTGSVALISSTTGPVASVTLSAGATANTAVFDGTISSLPGGIYTLSASYPGDGNFAGGAGGAVNLTINKEPSTTTFRTFGVDANGSPVPSVSFPYGGSIRFHGLVATASGQGVPTGNVAFFDGQNALAEGSINFKGEADAVMPSGFDAIQFFPTVGAHSLTAQYIQGDVTAAPSVSAPLTITITKATPLVDMAFFTDPQFVATQPGRLNAVVRPTGNIFPTGTLQYFDNNVPVGPAIQIDPTSGQAPFTVVFDAEGHHTFSASYSGDAVYNASTSVVFTRDVIPPFTFHGNNAATLRAGLATSFSLNLALSNSPSTFTGTVALACSSSSPAVTCSLDHTSGIFGPTLSNLPVTATVVTTTSAKLDGHPNHGWPLALTGVAAIMVAGLGSKRRAALALFALVFAIGISSCGGGGGSQPPPVVVPPNSTATVTVTATSGTHVATYVLNITITH